MARKSAWENASRTIRELLRVPEVRDNTPDPRKDELRAATAFDADDSAAPELKAARLFTRAEFRALFDHIPDMTRVTDVVISAYHALSTQTLIEGLDKALPSLTGVGDWKAQLAIRPPETPPPPALLGKGFRWSFVRDELPSLLSTQIERATDRRERLAAEPTAAGAHEPVALPELFFGQLVDGVQYLVDAKGHPLYTLGQGHITAAAFIADCQAGATLRTMTPVEALRLPWLDTVARAAWEGPVRDALEHLVRQATADFDTALAGSERLRFDGSMASAGDPGEPRRPIRRPL